MSQPEFLTNYKIIANAPRTVEETPLYRNFGRNQFSGLGQEEDIDDYVESLRDFDLTLQTVSPRDKILVIGRGKALSYGCVLEGLTGASLTPTYSPEDRHRLSPHSFDIVFVALEGNRLEEDEQRITEAERLAVREPAGRVLYFISEPAQDKQLPSDLFE